MGEYTTNIGIKNGLYERLKDRKSPGQSFSGVIEELLKKAEKYEELDMQENPQSPETQR
jgi:predicted CopG family antitoxin